jgi:hypothetical protein
MLFRANNLTPTPMLLRLRAAAEAPFRRNRPKFEQAAEFHKSGEPWFANRAAELGRGLGHDA